MPWAVKWISDPPLDGHCEYLMGAARVQRPKELAGCGTMLFASRADARSYIKEHYGYIAKRKDLRSPPHCWKTPKAVQVTVTVKER